MVLYLFDRKYLPIYHFFHFIFSFPRFCTTYIILDVSYLTGFRCCCLYCYCQGNTTNTTDYYLRKNGTQRNIWPDLWMIFCSQTNLTNREYNNILTGGLNSGHFSFLPLTTLILIPIILNSCTSKSKSCGLAVEYSAHDRGFDYRPMLDGNSVKAMPS